jgi:aryl-alcohol dehydrogenase-like predicted oxidoreductase
VYSRGRSEEIVGRALEGRRDGVVLATKVHGAMGNDPNMRGNSRRWIAREVEASLRRFRTDHLDLYQLHRPDPRTDLEETLEALTDLVRAGKVRYVGTSAFPAWQLVEAQWLADRRNLTRPRCEQCSYSILVRTAEDSVFPVARKYGIGVIVYSPLAGGWLTGKYRRDREPPEGSRMDRARTMGGRFAPRFDPSRAEVQHRFELVERLEAVADKAAMPLTHLAAAFTLAHPAVTSAIVGPRTMDQLDDHRRGGRSGQPGRSGRPGVGPTLDGFLRPPRRLTDPRSWARSPSGGVSRLEIYTSLGAGRVSGRCGGPDRSGGHQQGLRRWYPGRL